MVLWQSYIHKQKNEVRTLPHALCKKINSKLTKDLNVRAKTITFLEENISVKLYDLAIGHGFLTMTPEA